MAIKIGGTTVIDDSRNITDNIGTIPASKISGSISISNLSTATTQAESDSSTKIATTAYVTNKITTLIGGAPSTLNDLNELAAAINDDANYNSTLTTALATKLPLAGGALTGAVTTNSTFDGRNVSVDGSKLDGIEAGATADQTAAQILTAIKTVDGASSGLDADTVDGIQASSFLRSDANDTYTGLLSLGNTSSRIQGSDTYPLVQVNSAKAYFGSTSRATTVLASSSNIKHNRAGTEYDIWTSYNDGSGSGLDADTVDGVQASSFLRSDASDTATGALTLKNDNALFIQSATNGVGAKIKFSDEIGSYTQVGSIDYRHSDGYWDSFSGLTAAGDGFHFKGTEANTAFYFEGNASVSGDLTISNKIMHSGDTNNYMQFHAADQWRVVTGGSERLEVNNSQVTSTEPIHAPSFHGDGSALTGIAGIPTGVIVMWSGQTSAIPSGWALCNGSNGTPNLTDRFVMGAGTSNETTTGGANSRTLSVANLPSHTHTISSIGSLAYPQNGGNQGNQAGYGRGGSLTTNATGSGTAFDNRPSYMALAYIMKT